ncbi:hypothetical protein GIB67_007544 [Kingdonia uniflora]|uniref:TORTIFOLIA1/TORL1-2 C-terminal domain-containing protein n=1 Tax=Kingdonia uniflora TaxID=39325 RepID=A0A7J7LN76_9MAGN|nr:hypothetical protein GIB67_007544 [Kingdonia uniflora]
MAQDLAGSSGRSPTTFMKTFEGSSNRVLGKYNDFPDYSGTMLGRAGDGQVTSSERFLSFDSYSYDASRNGHMRSSRRGLDDKRSPTSKNDGNQIRNRRAWDKGSGSIRLGEGPSTRSVWQASKDEATLEAIRGAGQEDGESRGDDLLLVKLMERSGPIMDQLSNEITGELADLVMENVPNILGIPTEIKNELLLNLNKASLAMDAPEDWEGATPDQLLDQLA